MTARTQCRGDRIAASAKSAANTRRLRNETRDHSLPHSSAEKTARIDLGLALLSLAAKPGRKFTQQDIAAWCGCTRDAIGLVEAKALRRLYNALRFGRVAHVGRELAI